jgi:hypothetical protein
VTPLYSVKFGFFEKVIDKHNDNIQIVAVHPGSVATESVSCVTGRRRPTG